jgi:hypothetical protein
MLRIKTSFLILLAAAVIAAFGIAACGGDDDGGGDSTATTASTSSDADSGSGTGSTSSTSSVEDLGDTTDSAPATGEESAEVEDLLIKAVGAQLQESGITEDVATCIQEGIRDSIGPEDIEQLRAGITPPDLRAATLQAAQGCLDK